MYMNGKVICEKEANISPFDHGFLYGMGLFETFRVYNGHPFLLDDHLDRLNSGLKQLQIEQSFTREQVNGMVQNLLQENNIKHAYIRLNVSAGMGDIGLRTEPYVEPNVMVFIRPLLSAGELVCKQGQWLSLRRNTPEGAFRFKSHHYMNNMLAKREIGDRPDVEGFFLTSEGFVAEGVVSNIFWAMNDTLHTPSIETGILDGVTRRFVLALADKLKLKVEEGFYPPEALHEAEEVFVTNSIQEIVPIMSIADKVFPGVSGELVRMLHREYRSYIEKSPSVWSSSGL